MFNKVVLCGRISNDLELRQTNNGKSYCRFNLAVNRMNEGTDFITITVWNKQAENIVQYQSKGSLILVEGSISTGNYTDSDGNNRKTFEVIAQNVQFLGNKKIMMYQKNNRMKIMMKMMHMKNLVNKFQLMMDSWINR